MCLRSGMPEALNAYHSANWPSASGVIVSSSPSDDCVGGEGCIFFLDITYDFFVDGVKHESHRQEDWWFEWFRDRSARSYRAGKQIRVYYNPHNPGTSVMEPGLKLKHIGDILFSLLFVAGGMGLAVFGPAEWDQTGNA